MGRTLPTLLILAGLAASSLSLPSCSGSTADGTVPLYGACRVHADCASGLCVGGEDEESTFSLAEPFCSMPCATNADCGADECCSACLDSCRGLSGCCCGSGCLCESECTESCGDA